MGEWNHMELANEPVDVVLLSEAHCLFLSQPQPDIIP